MQIGLIAGSGQFPIIFCKRAIAEGYRVYVAAYVNEADPMLETLAAGIEWLHLGQLRRLITFFKKHRVTETVMMGAIQKTSIFRDVKPDIKAISLFAAMHHTHDDNILRAFANTLEKNGIRVRPSTFLLPDMLAEKGCWTKRKPSRAEKKDIDVGWQVAKEIGRLDIGQCVVVGGGSILAVEAIEGTDAAIQRGGSFGKGNSVVIKVCKPIQDERFDVPAVGLQTIQTMIESGVKLLVVEAGRAVVFDKAEMVSLADKAGISIVAMERPE